MYEVQSFRIIIETIINLIGPFWSVICVQISVFYVFGLIGIYLFGGEVNQENILITYDESIPSLYVFCNFNDMGSAFLTIFELMVVNNW